MNDHSAWARRIRRYLAENHMRIPSEAFGKALAEAMAQTEEVAGPSPRPVWPGDRVRVAGRTSVAVVIGPDTMDRFIVVELTSERIGYAPEVLAHLDGTPVSGLADQRRRRTKDEPPAKQDGDSLGRIRAWRKGGSEGGFLVGLVANHPDLYPEWAPCEPRRWSDD